VRSASRLFESRDPAELKEALRQRCCYVQ